MASKRLLNKIETIRKKVIKFNEDLEKYYQTSESRELPTIDCSIIGYEPFEPYTIEDIDNGIKVDADGFEIEVKIETIENWYGEPEEIITGWDDSMDGLKESLSYDRRRLNKAWRVWRADNPDAELEKDDQDE